MKKTLFLSAAALSLGAYESTALFNNAFTLSGDFAYFKREEGNKHKVVIDNSTTTCNCHYSSCTTKGLVHDFPFVPGFKVDITYTTEHSIWDLSYLWLPTWDKGCYKENAGSIIFSVNNPSMTYDFNGADKGDAHYGSEFQKCELNYFRYVTPRYGNYFSVAYLWGVQYLFLRENLEIAFTKCSDRSSYNVHVVSHIPALQVGGLLAWNPTRHFTWDLLVAVGVGLDVGKQKTFLGDYNNTVILRNYEKTGFSTPLVTEGVLRLTYQPTTYLNIHAAYQFIYLNGVALAPDQLVKSSSHESVYRAIGAPLFHGLTAGLGWSF